MAPPRWFLSLFLLLLLPPQPSQSFITTPTPPHHPTSRASKTITYSKSSSSRSSDRQSGRRRDRLRDLLKIGIKDRNSIDLNDEEGDEGEVSW